MVCSSDDLCRWRDDLVAGNKLIVVEGIKDRNALQAIGITNQIVLLSRKPLFAVVEDIISVARDVVILTDLDDEGKMLYSRLRHDLQRFGVRIDYRFREFLFRNTKIRQIEGLRSYLANL